MRQIIQNIGSVAKYESKLLVRSWFFKIYIAIATALVLWAGSLMVDIAYSLEQSTALIPQATVLALNIIQSLIIIFMSSDYLKRDKELDTSEVFYVRPLSNAEYLFGKVWGTLKPFLILDLVVMAAMYVVARFGFQLECQLEDFVIYLAIVTIPSLIFFIGVSTALMLIIGNQSITYLVILGLAWLSLVYTGSYMNYLFDMFMVSIPIAKSDVMGISNIGLIIYQRSIYIVLGLASMTLSVFLFHRLAGSHKLQRIFLFISFSLFVVSLGMIGHYAMESYRPDQIAAEVIALNTKYAEHARLEVKSYDIDLVQQPRKVAVEMDLRGDMSKASESVVFNLNGAMKVSSAELIEGERTTPLSLRREGHLIIVELGRRAKMGEEISMRFKYEGRIDEREMYVDIEGKRTLYKSSLYTYLNFDKRVAYIEPEWVVLTPESCWYVRPGVTYTNENDSWKQEFFSRYKLRVTPSAGMTPVSQGLPEVSADSLSYTFAPEYSLRSISLMISRYERYHTRVGGRDYSLYLHKSNRRQIDVFESISDTIPTLINDFMGDFERNAEMEYNLPRLTLVDVPEQTYSYKRNWSSTQELGQPELLLVPGAGASPMAQYGLSNYNVTERFKYVKDYSKRKNKGKRSEEEMKYGVLRGVMQNWDNRDVKSFNRGRSAKIQEGDFANSHYLPTILFNSRYNIISDSLSWGNQLIEIYYMAYESTLKNDARRRGSTGMSDMEQVMLLLEQDASDRYLSDPEYDNFVTEIILAQGNILFAEAMSHMGVEEFMETLKEIIEGREYKNVDMSEFLDSISVRSGCDVRKRLAATSQPIKLPKYLIGEPVSEKGYLPDEEVETYSTEVVIYNRSDVSGFVEVQLDSRDDMVRSVVEMGPNQIKRIVRHTTSNPRVSINTMNSANIPQYINLGSAKISRSKMPSKPMIGSKGKGKGKRRGAGRIGLQQQTMLSEEGDYILSEFEIAPEGDTIVDNEDEALFRVSDPPQAGYLNNMAQSRVEGELKYRSLGTRPSYKWALVSSQSFYGEHIKSAYQILKGDGNQYVEWSIPVKRGDRYALSFSATLPYEVRKSRDPKHNSNNGNQKQDLSYQFYIDDGSGEEPLKYDMRNMRQSHGERITWVWLGDYTAKQDTIRIKMTNKSDINRISADAVKATNITR